MACENGDLENNSDPEKTSIVLRGGTDIVRCKPVFTSDSKSLLVVSGTVVKVYSIATSSCIQELIGHRKSVTCVALHPTNRYQALSASYDETVIKWNYGDGTKLATYSMGVRILSLLPTPREDNTILAMSQRATERDPTAQYNKKRFQSVELVKFVLPVRNSERPRTSILEKLDQKLVSVGCKGTYVACVSNRRLKIISLKKKDAQKDARFDHIIHVDKSIKASSLACHPNDKALAVGTSDGVITLWHDIFTNSPIKSTYHWHALPVLDLCYTPQGSFLLSGGHESVLLKWQNNSSHLDKMPRLGAPIISISCSPDNQYYATCHADNVLQVLSSQLQVRGVFQGLTRAHVNTKSIAQSSVDTATLPAGLLRDPRSRALVMNGKPGHLQFFDMYLDKHVYNLDIVGQNYISPENLKQPLVLTDVECAAFNHNGEWLATVERRDDGETTPEIRLKLWNYNTKDQNYTLNTCVDQPHSKRVVCVKFRPELDGEDVPMLVTTSLDGKFKLWCMSDDTDIYRQNSCWHCESVGYYRDNEAGDAHFSDDGSLLGVVFGSTVTLWDPLTNTLRSILPHKSMSGKIKHINFGTGSCCQFLLVALDAQLVSWNLLTLDVAWSSSVNVATIAADPESSVVAVFTTDKSLLVIKPDSSEPIYSHERVSMSHVSAAIFLPRSTPNQTGLSWQRKSQLFFLNRVQELLSVQLDSDLSVSEPGNKLLSDSVKESVPSSMLAQVLAQSGRTVVPDHASLHSTALPAQRGQKYLAVMLTTPAHVLPPTSSMCFSFLQQLTGAPADKPDEDEEDEDGQTMAVHSDSSADSDMEVDTSFSKIAISDTTPASTILQKPEKSTVENEPDFNSLSVKTFSWLAT